MKPQYITIILFGTSLYWMYILYSPFLLAIIIAALLAVSTANIQAFFEKKFKNKLFAAALSSLLLGLLFVAPLGYFLTTLTIKLNTVEPQTLRTIQQYLKNFIAEPPEYLLFIKPYLAEALEELNINLVTANALGIAGKVGAFSAGFIKNAFLIIIFYFFAQYNGSAIIEFLKRIIQMSVDESSQLIKELSSVMSVVFYSIIATAMLEGFLFGIAISFMGHNGILFGIMYGFASLIPLVGGVFMWLPFMIYEFSVGNSTNAIFITLYSIVVISIIADTFVKPLIIKKINDTIIEDKAKKMNEMLIFFAIIAGLATFGFWGMILGPAITTSFLTVLKLFEDRSKACETFN